MRSARIQRNTRETSITLALTLTTSARRKFPPAWAFWTTCWSSFARHGDFDLAVRCEGDTQVDFHHSVEDIGICLGQAFTQALGDKRGITRYGQSLLPMDETLVLCACDLSGRDYLGWSVDFPAQKVGGDFDTELAEEFLAGLCPKLPRGDPYPANRRGKHPSYFGGHFQGHGPSLKRGRWPWIKSISMTSPVPREPCEEAIYDRHCGLRCGKSLFPLL